MRINHNISALNAWRQINSTNYTMSKTLERLSSGYRINRAGDDAAGLAISEKMRGQISGLNMAIKNAQDGISLIQTAEGALSEVHSILQRMRELAVQASSDTNTDADRTQLNEELQQLIGEVDRIAHTTEFNTKVLLKGGFGANLVASSSTIDTAAGVISVTPNGIAPSSAYKVDIAVDTANNVTTITVRDTINSIQQAVTVATPTGTNTATLNFGTFGLQIEIDATITTASSLTMVITAGSEGGYFHVGANQNQTISVSINNMDAAALSVNGISIATRSTAETAITTIDSAITTVSTERAKLGAVQNRLEHTVTYLGIAAENLTAAESRIRDADMAHEMMIFTKQQILLQSSTAMLAQANAAPQNVLQLLR
ncbi:MAG: flagellin [Thermotogaceae bacterium]|nr:flagellin [Thermotogaceae bacterium]